MAVMTSQLLDKPLLEAKAPPVQSADMMVLDSDLNGHAHDGLFEDAPPAETDIATPPLTLNGDEKHPPADMDISTDLNTLKPDSDTTSLPQAPTTVPPAIEAPISDVREMGTDATQSQPDPDSAPTQSTQVTAEETQPSTAPSEDKAAAPERDPLEPSAPTEPSKSNPVADLPDRTSDSLPPAPAEQTTPAGPDQDMTDAPSSGKVRAREDDDDEDNEPLAKRTKVEGKPTPAPETAEPTPAPDAPAPASLTSSVPATSTAASPAAPLGNGTGSAPPKNKSSTEPMWPSFDSEPMTPHQQNTLLQRIRNARKIKAAGPFNRPVDYVALNIPTYPEIIKEPMDLGTIENKLKNGQYSSVDSFLNDFNLMVRNCYTFNGREHAVSHSAADLERYVMNIFPTHVDRNGPLSAETKKPKKPAANTERKGMRRKSIAAAAPETVKPVAAPVAAPAPAPVPAPAPAPSAAATSTAAGAASPTDRFALKPDGTPVIRRDSTTQDGRPKRQIQRPKPRDLPYSVKPKKKKFELELRFCEWILTEVRKKQHASFVFPFLHPVDPVALNIPHYHKIIKKPMDLGTIDRKLHQGQYSTSKDFKNDFDLMLFNCFKFNPETDDVHKMGRSLQDLFQRLWAEKDSWIEQHQPQEPQSASEDEEEDEESSEDEIDDSQQQQLVSIQQQIAKLTSQAQNIIASGMKRTSPKVKSEKKKAKAGKTGDKKKRGSVGGSTKMPPLKVKKTKVTPLSFAQKQEISETIGTLDENNMRKAVQIIRNGVPSLKGVTDEELEIDMDIIPDDVLRELYKFLRGSRPKEVKAEVSDDEYEAPRQAKSSTTKRKNKPMGKKEQEESIRAIQRQLESFKNPGASGDDQSPPAVHDDSSSDDDGESESEEE